MSVSAPTAQRTELKALPRLPPPPPLQHIPSFQDSTSMNVPSVRSRGLSSAAPLSPLHSTHLQILNLYKLADLPAFIHLTSSLALERGGYTLDTKGGFQLATMEALFGMEKIRTAISEDDRTHFFSVEVLSGITIKVFNLNLKSTVLKDGEVNTIGTVIKEDDGDLTTHYCLEEDVREAVRNLKVKKYLKYTRDRKEYDTSFRHRMKTQTIVEQFWVTDPVTRARSISFGRQQNSPFSPKHKKTDSVRSTTPTASLELGSPQSPTIGRQRAVSAASSNSSLARNVRSESPTSPIHFDLQTSPSPSGRQRTVSAFSSKPPLQRNGHSVLSHSPTHQDVETSKSPSGRQRAVSAFSPLKQQSSSQPPTLARQSFNPSPQPVQTVLPQAAKQKLDGKESDKSAPPPPVFVPSLLDIQRKREALAKNRAAQLVVVKA